MGLEANWVLRHWCYGMCRRLVHRAESLREMTKKLVHHSPRPAPYTPRTLVHDEGKLSTRLMITHTPHALYPALWRKKPQIPSPIHPQFLMMIVFFWWWVSGANHFAGSTFKIYVDDILSLPIGEIMKAGGSDDAPDLEIVEVWGSQMHELCLNAWALLSSGLWLARSMRYVYPTKYSLYLHFQNINRTCCDFHVKAIV